MSLEHMVTAMSCLLSTCGNNGGTTLMRNSAMARPLDDVWGVGCRAKAVEFSDKLDKLLRDQLNATEVLSEIEKRVAQLKGTSTIGRRKRELTHNSDDIRNVRFDCNGKQKIEINADMPLYLVDCERKYYGHGWKLIASLDARHRKCLNEKDQYELLNGYENWERGDSTSDYFIGLKYLHAITASKGAHELLILTHDQQYGERMVGESVKHFMHYRSFAVADASDDYRLLSLDGYEGDIIDPLKAMLGNPFSVAQIDVADTDRVTMFVRSEQMT
ncbi:PREDICTED: uncharacterized protein LOC108374166 [Rhagoletis zephyria]|uniref:uncharacterized protein LOC108374166 n=1 Tax=Rhagoletis zephyria TaxID=28612 RepID=UPI0008115FA4|nr:PREDICTED: uncharacterized protein LOC108374166 [Rhagoletis zephyria]